MRLNKIFSCLAALAACTLIFTSCTRKPKLDLNGVAQNPSAQNAAGSGFGEDAFLPGPGNGFDGNGEGLGGGEWDSSEKPVAGSEYENFIQNGQRWQGVVYFAYDQSDIAVSERPKLDTLAEYLNANPGVGLVIEGHTDENGSDEYNRALGERRALSVQQYLSLLGVEDSRMLTVSYGEDRPVIPGATSDTDRQRNRRAEFILGDKR